jgi:predicted transglutaminase-like cysteine proteinase
MSASGKTARLPACCLCLLLLMATALPVCTSEPFVISERTLSQAEREYGPGARQRLLDWQELVRTGGEDDLAKLERVNRFFNTMTFVDDAVHWKKTDYWATPLEFVASEGGDCEDFAIAKYFTLIRLGIAENRLTLTYVKALRLDRAHMVLTYYPAPGAEPLVLDNLVDVMRPSSQRTDLLPVYSLNGSGLWLAKQRGKGKMVGDSSRLKRWRELLDRMTDELNFDEDMK